MAFVAQPHTPQPEEQQRKQDEQKKQETRITRARLVQRLVANDGNLPEFMHDLITTQAVVVAGTEAAAFLIEGQQGDGKPELRTVAHVRPDNSEEAIRRQAILAFREIVTQCILEDKDGALRIGEGTNEVDPQFCLVTLLRNENRVVAATAVITRCKDEGRALQRLSTMQLVAGYFDFFLLKRQNEQARQVAKTHQDVFQFASTVSTAENFHASAVGLCNELATRFGAARVAIGWVKGKHVKLEAISHTEEFDKKQELSVQLVKVMEECLDQDEFTQFDPAGASTDNVTRDAMTLSQMEGGNRVASLPLRRRDKIVGVLTLEFPPEKPGSPAESTALAVAAELLAPQLCDRYDNDRYLITKAGLSTKNTTKMIFGLRQHTLAKVLIAGAIAVLAFLCLYSPTYRVSAPFAFVPLERRVVDSPFAAVIAEVYKDVGQEVRAGDPILKLDTRIQESELRTARFQQNEAYAQARAWLARDSEGPGAMAQHDAEQARAEALGAQIAKLEEDIRRSTITAPINGVLLQAPGASDLTERIGTTVQVGDQIVLVGDPGKLRIEIAVADRDIDDVKVGQLGTLATAAEPGKKVPIKVERIIEAAEATEGNNAFTVYASPVGEPDIFWRPSGTGEVRLDAGNKPLIWQWTHRLVDWVRLKLWI